MRVLVYDDGVHNNDILFRRLTKSFGIGNVMRCDAEDIKHGILDFRVFMLAMPGGADLHYCRQLNGEGNKRIQDYVARGGNYLGICAGLYFAARRVAWHGAPKIEGARELGFFPGVAEGPQFNDDGAWKYLKYVFHDGQRYPVYYAGGGVLRPDTDACADNYRVLMTDDAGAADAIECRVGRGRAYLLTSHYEHTYREMSRSGYLMPRDRCDNLETLTRHFMDISENVRTPWDIVMERIIEGAGMARVATMEKRLQIL